MKNQPAVYVRCLCGNDVLGDVKIDRRGDLIQLVGNKTVEFCPAEATRVAVEMNRLATEITAELERSSEGHHE